MSTSDMFEQAAVAAAVAFPPYESTVVTVAGLIILGYNYWLARRVGQVWDIVRDTHHALCGNPQVPGDKGIAGRLVAQEERQAETDERVNTIEWHLSNTVAMKDHTHGTPDAP